MKLMSVLNWIILLCLISMNCEHLQSSTNILSASFRYSDKESGVDHYKVQIYEVSGGTRRQKYPGISQKVFVYLILLGC